MKKTRKKHPILIAVLVVFALCLVGAGYLMVQYGPRLGIYLVPPSAEGYGKIALDFIDSNGVYAGEDGWEQTYSDCLAQLKNAESYTDTYEIIRAAAAAGGGKHSSLTEPDTADSSADSETLMPEVSLDEGTAYIKLPMFIGTAEQGSDYSKTVQEFLHSNASNITGIVLDLRDNRGGDCGPMLSAVASLLPDGKLVSYHCKGYDIDVAINGGSLANAGSGGEILYPGEKLDVPVAVLFNDMTGSSGEVVLLCFRGGKNVKTFGVASAGYSSVNQSYRLYDGAMLNLTVAGIKTSTGELFMDEPILPDVVTEDADTAAREWLGEVAMG